MSGLPFVPHEGKEPYIFVSYSSKDKDKVMSVLERLHEQGYRLWWDKGLKGGDTWWRKILERLHASCLMLLFVTPNANESEWVADEVFEARKRSKKIFPVYLEPVPNLTLPITRYHFVEQWACASEDDFLGKIYDSLPTETGQPLPPVKLTQEPPVKKQQPAIITTSSHALPPKSEFINGKWTNLYTGFGKWDWLVLDVDKQNNRVLLITKDIIDQQPYNERGKSTTWAECSLRKFLNNQFKENCSTEDWNRIHATEAKNPDNPWFGTKGGNDTEDKVFLLSLEETRQYLGLDETKLLNRPKDAWWISDENNKRRVAKFNNSGSWWWLRSPGGTQGGAAGVGDEGRVGLFGYSVSREAGGVRPALWLNL